MTYPLIAVPIWISLVCYALAMGRWFMPGKRGWSDAVARFFWILSCTAYLLHVAAAFHFYYHWSHEEALAFTAAQSGFGPGLFITYAFTCLWLTDALWAWLAASSYAARKVWLACVVHTFIAFILFNGAVVFARGFSRALGIAVAVFVGLIVLWSGLRRNLASREH